MSPARVYTLACCFPCGGESGTPCDNCATGTAPVNMVATITGLANALSSNCGDANATWTVDGTVDCSYSASEPPIIELGDPSFGTNGYQVLDFWFVFESGVYKAKLRVTGSEIDSASGGVDPNHACEITSELEFETPPDCFGTFVFTDFVITGGDDPPSCLCDWSGATVTVTPA